MAVHTTTTWLATLLLLLLSSCGPARGLVSGGRRRHDLASGSRAGVGVRTRTHAWRRKGAVAVRMSDDPGVRLEKPLGIVFEECEPGEDKGVFVAEIVEGGNADAEGNKIQVGDKLIEVSAVLLEGEQEGLGGQTLYTNWKRTMIPCGNLGFQTIMSAISSNDGRYGYKDVIIKMRRTDKSVFRRIE